MLKCVELTKDYDQQPLLRRVNFDVRADEIVCLLGPSGSGKSTILRIIAGLETPKSGQVLWEGEDLSLVPVHKRQFGLMFQDYALFPHRSVAENVAFGLRMQKLSRDEIDQRVNESLRMVNMTTFADRTIMDLSGGEQQRVALARSLAPRPRLLMLDEPLGALDHRLRVRLQGELRQILCQTHIPAIYVTHDHEEAFSVADRLIVLKDGQIEQEGPPTDVFSAPNSAWVAAFFGMGNLFPGRILQTNPLRAVVDGIGEWSVATGEGELTVGQTIVVLARPQNAVLGAGENELTVTVKESRFKGNYFENVGVMSSGMTVEFNSDTRQIADSQLVLHFPSQTVQVLKH